MKWVIPFKNWTQKYFTFLKCLIFDSSAVLGIKKINWYNPLKHFFIASFFQDNINT